jgi:Zn ribbon nucleic-acid-binding protein
MRHKWRTDWTSTTPWNTKVEFVECVRCGLNGLTRQDVRHGVLLSCKERQSHKEGEQEK